MADHETLDATLKKPDAPNTPDQAPLATVPQRIGRYRVERVLGKGGFGLVYLAHDEQLSRRVAVKVPHARLISGPEDAGLYLAEARTVANLDHPTIVPVYDIGGTAEFPCYVVSKYIEGIDLASQLRSARLGHVQGAELVATIAEALHYAHKQGLVHRDVKPGNILLGDDGRPHLVDFGLALHEQDVGRSARFAGTPAYMSPEQARGEGHRVDGRSDIFSLGVVLYELLTARRPFAAPSQSELFEQITSLEVRPPRQIDDKVPKELERICLKALSKRAADRYTTAKDLAEDLRHFLAKEEGEAHVTGGEWRVAGGRRVEHDERSTPYHSSPDTKTIAPGDTPPAAPDSESRPVRIVPKGLRSFDRHDADFFLELLPGPRDRDGLPGSLRFWKTRIEETDPNQTFEVGLIYGPSGCGKSSLVKAGLLPRLSQGVIAVYVEATAEETETRLLNGLRKACPAVPADSDLPATLAALRQGQGLPLAKKVLIILDQFEQWLHAKKEATNAPLVHALRQCDGGHVQCIVMVRDDFWMAATHFMRDLEIRLLEGQNSAAVDLFPIRHAEKVLAAFGRAFGVLLNPRGRPQQGTLPPENSAQEFIAQAVTGLAQEGKVICVRLALFAEMMKSKSWTPATLKEVGGAEGVGVTFLEETFSAATAPPEHRYHQKAARAVLAALLPESGADIKGHMRSYQELLAASGYGNRPRDFDDLLRILDGEIRLITPTDAEGKEETKDEGGRMKDESDSSFISHPSSFRYYQLTHDYLVPSLRDWLTRKQKETRRGRAELRLAERSAIWNAKPERRYLPSLGEYLSIVGFTPRKSWTLSQRKMMRAAGRVRGLRAAGVALLLVAAAVSGLVLRRNILAERERVQRENVDQQLLTRTEGLVDSLLSADTSLVPGIVRELGQGPCAPWAEGLLQAELEGAADGSIEKLHLSLALVDKDPQHVEYLYEQLLRADVGRFPVIRDALAGHASSSPRPGTPGRGVGGEGPGDKDEAADGTRGVPATVPIKDRLWTVLAGREADPEQHRLRAAGALAKYDPTNAEWNGVLAEVAGQLVAVNPVFLGQWQAVLRPMADRLVPPLSKIFADSEQSELARSLATSLLAQYAKDDPHTLTSLVIAADAKAFATLIPELQKHKQVAVKKLLAVLGRQLEPDWKDPPLDPAWIEPSPATRAIVESAHGMLSERFAFCQDLPWGEFRKIAETLRSSGYRPTRVRPWARDGGRVVVAAIWTRDGNRWELQADLSLDQLPKSGEPAEKDGLVPADLAVLPAARPSPRTPLPGVPGRGEESAERRFALLWSEPNDTKELRVLLVDLSSKAFPSVVYSGPTRQVLTQVTINVWTDAAGQRRYAGIWSNQGATSEPYSAYEGFELVDQPQWDVAVAPAAKLADPLDVQRQQLQNIAGSPAEQDKPSVRITRAKANYYLGNLESALADLDFVLEKGTPTPELYQYHQYRAWTLARLGRSDEAQSELKNCLELQKDATLKEYARIVLEAWLGQGEKAITRLAALEAAAAKNPDALYNGACAAALAAKGVEKANAAHAQKLTQRALELLAAALSHGYQNAKHIGEDPDLAGLHGEPRFLEILEHLAPPARYAGLWRADVEFESKLLTAVPLDKLSVDLKPLLAQGYRPFAISIDSVRESSSPRIGTPGGGVGDEGNSESATLLLHRPLVPDTENEQLALEKATAAVALLRLNAPEQVWPLLEHSPDPRLRSYLLSRLAAYEFDPAGVLARLGVGLEVQPTKVGAPLPPTVTDISRRRALILGLGEYARAKLLSPEQKAAAIADLARWYANDPDPGVHGAAEWSLAQLGAEEKIASVRAAYSTGQAVGERRWFLTKTKTTPVTSGLPFVILEPTEFLMGSPVSEANRMQGPHETSEIRHRRRIGRRFSIGMHEVTVAQFQAYHSDHPFDRTKAREEGAPANMITWDDAAAYCNWLSEKEGIPPDQWCYEFRMGNWQPYPDCLQRTGYRLPTEAEWEYACRAGAATAYYFGETDALLREYAWYSKSSSNRWMLPVGRLKPNDYGLFDMYGNAREWCQDWAQKYGKDRAWLGDNEQMGKQNIVDGRALRGGSINDAAPFMRSACRISTLPYNRDPYTGFRVARTLP